MEPAWAETETRFRTYLLSRRRRLTTAKTYVANVRLFNEWVLRREGGAVNASAESVAEWITHQLDTRKHNVVALRLTCLRAFYRFCRDTKLRLDDPTLDLSICWEDLRPRRPLSRTELDTVLAACRNDRDRDMICVAYATGLRVAELVNLNEDDIDFESGLIIVKGKGGNEAVIRPGRDTLAILMRYTGKPRGVLWWTKDGRPMSVKRAGRNMEEIAARSGVHMHWHRLRTTFANRVLALGVPLEDLQRMMRHKSLDVTRHYAGATIEERAMQTMARLNLASDIA